MYQIIRMQISIYQYLPVDCREMSLASAVGCDMSFRQLRVHFMKITFFALLIAALVGSLSSCIPLAAGAAAGYVARDQGYKVQSPIKKSGN